MKNYENKQTERDCPDLSQDFGKPEKRPTPLGMLMLPLTAILLFGGLLWLYMQNRGQSGQLVINEVVTSNKTCLTDEILGTPDFVELYNGSSRTVPFEEPSPESFGPGTKPVKININHRSGVERQNLTHHKAAADRDAERPME